MMPLFELPMHIILCFSIVFGIYAACQPGMLVDRLLLWAFDFDIWVSKNVFLKPVYTCPICMSSVWGIAYAVFMQVSVIGPGWTMAHVVPLVLGVAGVNYIVMQLINND